MVAFIAESSGTHPYIFPENFRYQTQPTPPTDIISSNTCCGHLRPCFPPFPLHHFSLSLSHFLLDFMGHSFENIIDSCVICNCTTHCEGYISKMVTDMNFSKSWTPIVNYFSIIVFLETSRKPFSLQSLVFRFWGGIQAVFVLFCLFVYKCRNFKQ